MGQIDPPPITLKPMRGKKFIRMHSYHTNPHTLHFILPSSSSHCTQLIVFFIQINTQSVSKPLHSTHSDKVPSTELQQREIQTDRYEYGGKFVLPYATF